MTGFKKKSVIGGCEVALKSKSKKVDSSKKSVKSKKKDVVAAEVAAAPARPALKVVTGVSTFKHQDFVSRLTEKLSHFDANMILEAAMLSVGVEQLDDGCYKKEEVQNICLALIKKGGPAFAVGTRIYRELVG
ncbi:MAG: hypothetical protein IT289_06030 [Oligoflexia bacterium]|nr:hypothetical protein [Oligoflexia bacterium]